MNTIDEEDTSKTAIAAAEFLVKKPQQVMDGDGLDNSNDSFTQNQLVGDTSQTKPLRNYLSDNDLVMPNNSCRYIKPFN